MPSRTVEVKLRDVSPSDPRRTINAVTRLVSPKVGVIRSVGRGIGRAQDPECPSFGVSGPDLLPACGISNSTKAGGAGESTELALAATIGEAMERYCTWFFDRRDMIVESFDREQLRRQREAELELLARDAELTAIKSQLQPHFVLNSLNSILALVAHDPTRAKAMLERLASFLQSVFDRLDEPLVLLERELDTVRDYLKIEQVRFGDRLRFAIDVDGATEQVAVPPFLLQPLVENAVKHGIQPYSRQGEVRVTARRRGARVHVAVSDTGGGPKVSRGTNGRGIDLTRRRLRATYGDDGALLSMSREEGGGFAVSLDLPAEPERLRGFSSSGVDDS